MTTTHDDTAARNREAGYTGLGMAEFVALALHENRGEAAVLLGLLGYADEGLRDEWVLAMGRSSLAARGLLETATDAADESGESVPLRAVGLGGHVSYVAGHATTWLTVVLFGAPGEAGVDGLLVAIAPDAGLVVVRRPLSSVQVAPADIDDGVVGLAWDLIERHLAETPGGAVAITPSFHSGAVTRTMLVRHARRDDASIDTASFEVALGRDLDREPVDEILTLDDEALDALLERELRVDDAAGGDA